MNNLSNSFAYAAPGIIRGTIKDYNAETIRKQRRVSTNNDQIIINACRFFDVSVEQVKGPSRKEKIVLCRHLSMTLIKNYSTLSLKDIGDLFGGRHHSTIIKSLSTIKDTLSLPYSGQKEEIHTFLKIHGYNLPTSTA